ncbi:MAG: UDP-glucose 4-epimerase GalE [Armatimonadetes bacterium]|nr:UDP-glucose 4-epimerase GalE [Armatimonadota bacterium]
MRSTLLVVGGAGYVGSAVAAALMRAGHQVLIYDNLSHGHREAVPAGADLIVGDLEDRDALDRVFRGARIDAVLHFAALIEAGESMQVPERYFRNNTANTMGLLEAMIAHNVRAMVFSSTAAVYGIPERMPIQEEDRLAPINPYGESKLIVERMLHWHNITRGLRYACLRYFNACGATSERGEDHAPESHLIPLVLRVALGKRDSIAIFGSDYETPDGTCVRDYVHVEDLAAAHVLALEALQRQEQKSADPSESRMIYNLGSGTGYSVRQVVEVARAVTGHPIPAEESPRRPGDPPVLVASAEKIKRELGWRPRHGELQTIVSSAWDWHRAHPDGYRA